MKSFAFGMAVALTFSYLFTTREALPMVIGWALYAWIRNTEAQKVEDAFSCEKDCECEEEVADEADVESVEDAAAVRPMTVPPPATRCPEDK